MTAASATQSQPQSNGRPDLTPEQIAKAAERKAAKLAKKAALADALANGEGDSEFGAELEKGRFLQRAWVDISSNRGDSSRKGIRIVTWNILAQTLVRRELFPGSDCLKWGDRKPMLQAELEHHGGTSDILCLQECDRLDAYLPSLLRHSHIKASGHGKLHGLVILYRKDRFDVRASKTVYLDEEELVPTTNQNGLIVVGKEDSEARRRRGGSRQTKNIGLIVALQGKGSDKGIIVATTHLFWHPKYAYERVRQCTVLLRAIRRFQEENDCSHWPSVFAGDLNTQPSEATYQLLVAPHRPLPPAFVAEIEDSRFVHSSVVKVLPTTDEDTSTSASASGTGSNTPAPAALTAEGQTQIQAIKAEEKEEDGEGGEEEESNDKSKALKGTRPPQESDGILDIDELVKGIRELMPEGKGMKSAYGTTRWSDEKAETFALRDGFGEKGHGLEEGHGQGEPAYTCFTALFKLTLDYLLLIPPTTASANSDAVEITGLLGPPRLDQLGEGLPRKGICASDHLAMGCEINW